MFIINAEKFDKIIVAELGKDEKYNKLTNDVKVAIKKGEQDDICSSYYLLEQRVSEFMFEKGIQYGMNFIISNIKNTNDSQTI